MILCKGLANADKQLNETENRRVYWKHVAPLTGRQARSYALGLGWWQEVEPDPLGVDAGLEDPYLNQPEEYQSPDLLTPRFGDMGDMNTGCTLDGFAMSCDRVMRLIDAGAAVGEFRDKQGKLQQVDLRVIGGSTIWVDRWEDYGSTGDGQFTLDEDGTAHYSDAVTSGSRNVGFFIDVGSMLPQGRTPTHPDRWLRNPTPNVADLRNRVTSMANNPDCSKFIAALLDGAKELTGVDFESTDATKLFDAVVNQRGFIYGDTIRRVYGFDGATVHGSISRGTAQVELSYPSGIQIRNNPRMAAEHTQTQLRMRGVVVLHELMHLAAKGGWYTDETLAAVVRNMPGSIAPRGDITQVRPASDYWNSYLEKYCKPRL